MLYAFTAALGLLLLSGGALIGALLMIRRERLEMENRVKLVAAAPNTRTTEAVGLWLKAGSSHFNVRLQRVFAAGVEHTWGMKAGPIGLVIVALMAAIAAWALVRVAIGLSAWLAGPAAACAAFFFPRVLLLRQQKKAERLFSDLFPDAVDAIARMLRAGLPIASAVRSVSDESPPPVSAVFTMIADQIAIGASIEDALDASTRHIGLQDFRFFSVAVALQHATGGNLAATLETLSDIIRKRRAVRLKAGATTAEIRVSAYVLGALPFLIVGALLMIQPGYLTPLFVDPRGHVVLAMAAGGLLLAWISMRQMMRSVTNL
jgi:tight adherence protein B